MIRRAKNLKKYQEKIELLVIEDNIEAQELIQTVIHNSIKKDGFRSEIHIDFKTSIGELKNINKDLYDIVFLDLNLPDSKGLSTCALAKDIFPFLPIVVLTGKDETQTAIDAVKIGMQDYIPKSQLIKAPLTKIIYHSMDRFHQLRHKDRLVEEKTVFLAKMSHEIRQPMNGIMGIASLMETANTEEERFEYLKTIRTSCSTLLEIVNNILNLSTIEAKTLNLINEEFNLREVIEEATKLFGVMASDKRILLSELVDTNCPIYVHGDAIRLKQILTNLISNSIKYTNKGSVKILASCIDKKNHMIKVKIQDTGLGISEEGLQKLFLPYSQVSDLSVKIGGTGLGLCLVKELVEAMGGELGVESTLNKGSTFWFTIPFSSSRFLKNERMDLHHKSAFIVSDVEIDPLLVQQLKNRSMSVDTLEVSSQCNYESLDQHFASRNFDMVIIDFRHAHTKWIQSSSLLAAVIKLNSKLLFLVPFGVNQKLFASHSVLLGPAHQSILYEKIAALFGEKKSISHSSHFQIETKFEHLKILVVDDAALNRTILSKMLKTNCAEVVEADSGCSALNLIKKNEFDIIFLDCQMPNMNGFELTKLIRETPQKSQPIIIAMTGDTSLETINLCKSVGMNDYISKPYSPKDILACIQKFCKNK